MQPPQEYYTFMLAFFRDAFPGLSVLGVAFLGFGLGRLAGGVIR
jgi:hypothetical protein